MKLKSNIKIAALLGVVTIAMFAGCSDSFDAAEIAANYTEETAKAIIEGSWQIATAIFVGLIINGAMS